jgi:lipoprotein-releasing system ATP-binding protein
MDDTALATSPAPATTGSSRHAPPVLEAIDVHKSYRLARRDIPVLRGIDLHVDAGETVALLGASGAGKSTLLHVLGLLDTPTKGEIRYDGRKVDDLSVARRARLRHDTVGFVFQFYHLIPELSALRNVELGGMMHTGLFAWLRTRGELRRRAEELLAMVGLSERLGHRPRELSGGERQRVAIARALIAKPKVILADEPTGNLDTKTADEVLDVMFRVNREQGIAFVIVTHNEAIAERCARTIRLRDGIMIDTPSRVRPRPPESEAGAEA